MAAKKKRGGSRRSWGSVRPLESGRWQARYKPHPGAKYICAPMTFRLKGEADEWLTRIRADLTRGEWIDPNRSMLEFEPYAREWVRTRIYRGKPLRDSTREKYLYRLETYVFEDLGPLALGHVHAEAIRDWHTGLGHIPATQAQCYKLVRSILTTAVRDGRLKKNPCSIDGAGFYKSPERTPAVEEEILAAVRLMPERERVWVLLACWGGMRRGELAGLRRWQIDVEMQTIHIGPTRVAVGGRFVDQDIGKSDAADRFVVVPKLIMDCVVAHLDAFVDDDPMARVFTGVRDRAKPIVIRTLDNHWHKAREKIGRPTLTMHDLRHSGSTIQSTHGGASQRERMDFFGWTREEEATRYDHVIDGRHVEIAERLNARLADSNVIELFPRAAARPRPGETSRFPYTAEPGDGRPAAASDGQD